MDEKCLVGLSLVIVNFIALGLLGRFSPRLFWPVDWFPRWTKKVTRLPGDDQEVDASRYDALVPFPLTPPEPELPESGVVIHHKKVCTCQHGCKSGECDK